MTSSLIAKLEEAREGSRELDAEIDALLFGGRAAHLFDRNAVGGVRASYSAGTVFNDADPTINGGCVLTDMHRRSEPVTTSIDAALALAERVLRGCRVMTERDHDGSGWAMVKRDALQPSEMSEGATAPLALCIAILKAKHKETTT